LRKLFIPAILLLVCTLIITSSCGQKISQAPTVQPTVTSAVSPTPTTVSSSTPGVTSTQALSPSPSEPGKPKYGGIMRMVAEASPQSPLGWLPDAVGEAARAQQPVLEPFVRTDSKGNVTPRLATSWVVDPDNKTITFTLRKGVKFHDGSDFNARAAKFNMETVKAAKRAGTQFWASIDVVDDYTIRITFTEWRNSFLASFSESNVFMVSPTAYEKNGVEWMRANPVGTGPFKFVSFERDVKAVYTRYENYWDTGKPYVDGLQYLYIADPLTQKAVMISGAADAIMLPLGLRVAELRDQGLNVITGLIGTYPLVPDAANPESPYANIKVRQAVEYAIDKEAIAASMSYGFWTAAYQFATPNSTAYDPNLPIRKYDPNKAKQLLSEAGYPNGFKTKLIASPMGLNRDVLIAIQSYLAKVGIQAEIELPEYGKFTEYRTKGWKNALLSEPMVCGVNVASSINSFFGKATNWYYSMKRSDELETLLVQALTTKDPEPEMMKKVVKQIADESIYIPVHYFGEGYPMQKYVRDPGFLTTGNMIYWRPDTVWLDK